MNAYVINLTERRDRWIKFCIQETPFQVIRFEAIKGGSLGCLKSHLEVMKQCDDEILIFEDDCKILESWSLFWKAYDQLPDDWDCLYLGANLHEKLERHSENLFRIKLGWSTHGILYRRKLIDKILSDGIDVVKKDKNIDTYMARRIQPYFKCFIIYPLFSTQHPGQSDIINGYRGCDDLIPNYEKYTG